MTSQVRGGFIKCSAWFQSSRSVVVSLSDIMDHQWSTDCCLGDTQEVIGAIIPLSLQRTCTECLCWCHTCARGHRNRPGASPQGKRGATSSGGCHGGMKASDGGEFAEGPAGRGLEAEEGRPGGQEGPVPAGGPPCVKDLSERVG